MEMLRCWQGRPCRLLLADGKSWLPERMDDETRIIVLKDGFPRRAWHFAAPAIASLV
jgi:hypothetical protein